MRKLLIILIICALAVAYFIHENTDLGLTEYTYASSLIPAEFDGFRILQISDLHDALIGENNSGLIKLARSTQPDIIVMTGDMADANRTHTDRTLSVVSALTGVAPVYYVNGNHEAALTWNVYNGELKKGFTNAGVTVLEDSAVYLERGEARIQLAGLRDMGFVYSGDNEKAISMMAEAAVFITDEECFTVLLSHRPEITDVYTVSNAQLILSGHSHGGQVRLPFIGGLYSPGEGLFPKYDGGVYDLGAKTLIVSRGVGNSSFPLRIFDNPELVLITLRTK